MGGRPIWARMVGVHPHVYGLVINPDGDNPNLVELTDWFPALEAFGTVPRGLEELFDSVLAHASSGSSRSSLDSLRPRCSAISHASPRVIGVCPLSLR